VTDRRPLVLVAIVLILGSAFIALKIGKKNSGQDTIIPTEEEHTEEEQPSEEAEQEYVFTSDWMDGQGVLVYGRPPLDYLAAVNATGVTWSVYWLGLNEAEAEYVRRLHEAGYKVSSNFATVQGGVTLNETLRGTARCVGLWGEPSTFVGGQPFMCHNNPEWARFLETRIREHIDGGADAIHIDEIEGNGGHLDIAGFCPHCMAGFREYLRGVYSSEELSINFGIEDVSSFDYGGYLRELNASTVWEDPNRELLNEYLRFQYTDRFNQIRDLIHCAKEYAGRPILVSANVYGLLPNLQIYTPLLDFAVAEAPFRLPPVGQTTLYFLAEATGLDAFYAFPDIFNLASLGEGDNGLWRSWFAEAQAAGGSLLLPYKAYTYGGGSYTLPTKEIEDYARFVARSRELYEGTTRLADVGLLHSLGSTLYDWGAWEGFTEAGLMLQALHSQFEVVYIGDGEFVSAALTLEELLRYGAIVVPARTQLDQATGNLLQMYEESGGTVVQLDEETRPDELTGLLPGGSLETSASSDVGVTTCVKEESLIVHMINYRYDYQEHTFTPQTDIELSVRLPTGLNPRGECVLVSPDTGMETMDYVEEGNWIRLRVQTLQGYAVIEIS